MSNYTIFPRILSPTGIKLPFSNLVGEIIFSDLLLAQSARIDLGRPGEPGGTATDVIFVPNSDVIFLAFASTFGSTEKHPAKILLRHTAAFIRPFNY